jgi:exosortase D (VPLPA-CTERM-specific)
MREMIYDQSAGSCTAKHRVRSFGEHVSASILNSEQGDGSPLVTAGSIGDRWGMSSANLLIMLLLTALLIWVCFDALAQMVEIWFTSPEYSHAALIPLISAFLIWQKRPLLQQHPVTGSWAGMGLILIAGLVCLVGKFGAAYFLVEVAFVTALYGVILSCVGWARFRVLLAPLLILMLMIPLPPSLNGQLSAALQLWSSNLGVMIIRLFGIAVYQEGNVIDLGQLKLQVAEACSGLRYLYPLMTLGFIVGYVYKGAMWKRVVLFLSTVPLTIIMNSVRIGIIGVLVEKFGSGMAEGFLHEFEGWMVFMLCTVLLMVEVGLLNRIGREAGTWRDLFSLKLPPRGTANLQLRPQRVSVPLVGSAIVVVALAVVSLLMPYRVDATPGRAQFLDFPLRLGPWQGQRGALESVYLDTLKLDDYLLADYSNLGTDAGQSNDVNLYVAYYAAQPTGLATIHTPKNCLPGGGWAIRDFGQRTLSDMNIGGHPLRVNRALVQRGDQRAIVYYWFQERGRSITNEYAVKVLMFWDAITRNRTDGAMVRLMTPLAAGSAESNADGRLLSFARLAAPVLPRFVPD